VSDKNTKTYDFTYDGAKRHVIDATFEPEHNTIVGMEETKGGKKTEQIKRYSVDKITKKKES
jgi:hypothetical protein